MSRRPTEPTTRPPASTANVSPPPSGRRATTPSVSGRSAVIGLADLGGLVPGALVALRPLEELVEAVGGIVEGRVQVAPLGEPRGDGGDGEVARHDVVDLVPEDRRGDGAVGDAASGV